MKPAGGQILKLSLCVALAATLAGAQSCEPTTGNVLEAWCNERCLATQAWLRLRFSYDFFDHKHFQESSAVSLWSMCPQAWISLLFARAALELRRRPRVSEARARRLRNECEYETRRLFLDGSFNLSVYFMPSTLSFAPFFHMGQFVQELRAYPELLRPDDNGPAALPMHIAAHKALDKFSHALRYYLELDDIPPPLSAAPEPDALTIAAAGGRCSALAAALLFAAADARRLQLDVGRWQEVRQLILKGADIFRCAVRTSDRPFFLAEVASTRVPVFEVLDRLDRQIVVPLQLEDSPIWQGRIFPMHVLPTQNLESGHVRGLLKLHCDLAFQRFAQERYAAAATAAASASPSFFVVEVGAHLGGCTLFAMTHLGSGVQALAVEPFAHAAAALRRTAKTNGMVDSLHVEERFICEGVGTGVAGAFAYQRRITEEAPWQHQPEWVAVVSEEQENSSAASSVLAGGAAGAATDQKSCARLDEVLREQGVAIVDLLRVHVLGQELSVLRSALPYLQAGMVKAAAVAIFSEDMFSGKRQDAAAIGRLLRSHGFAISYQGLEGDAAEAALAPDARPTGTSTLLATLASAGSA